MPNLLLLAKVEKLVKKIKSREIYSSGFFLCLLLSIFLSKISYASHAFDPQWLALLHYEKTSTGYESIAEGDEFFLSKNGKLDPQGELDKTLASFTEPQKENNEE